MGANLLRVIAGVCAIVLIARLDRLQSEASAHVPPPVDVPQPIFARRPIMGSRCNECGRPLAAAQTAVACRSCGGVYHARCAQTAICNHCGGDDLVRGTA